MSREADFWSRRRARVEAEAQARARAEDAEAREADLAERSDAELCEDLGLPDPDMLQPGDDFSAFMARAVPERLRRRALRRLWRSNPVLANVDGLVDYGEDYTDSAMVTETLQTAYQVGRGMTAHLEELVRQAEAEAQKADGIDPGPGDAESEPAQAALTQVNDNEPDTCDAEIRHVAVSANEAVDEAADLPPRRRMRFAFVDRFEVSA